MRRVVYLIFWVALLSLGVHAFAPHWRYYREVYSTIRQPMPHSLPVPVAGVSSRQLRDTWHAERGGGRKHEGIDIFARCGAPVISATDGLVTSVTQNNLGGQTVGVLGPGRYWHYYAHLSEYGRFKAGDLVKTGDVLGYVGNTGNARGTPCHLHYGLYAARGDAINPYAFLAPQKGAEHRQPASGKPPSGLDAAQGSLVVLFWRRLTDQHDPAATGKRTIDLTEL